MDSLEVLQKWFLRIRNGIIYDSVEDIEKIFTRKIGDKPFKIFGFGSFDEKIIVVCFDEMNRALICSVDKPLVDTNFYRRFSKIVYVPNFFNQFSVINRFNSIFFEELKSPKIALLSLAKNNVYTFPRFALGISDIAHSIRKRCRGSVSLYDLQLNPNIDETISAIKDSGAHIIGISMTFGLFDVLEEVLQSIKKQNLKCLIVVGGSLAGITYKEILKKYPEIIVSFSEGESFFVDLIDYYRGICKLKDISGAAFVDNESGNIIETPQTNFHKDRELSIPELDLLIPTIKSKGVFQLETSRGCYNACSFCPRKQKGMWRGNIDDIRNIEILIEHFCERLKSHEIDASKLVIYVVDEEFVGGEGTFYQDRAAKISEIFSKHNLRYETSFRMNTIYSSHLSSEDNIRKIKNMMTLRDNGLNRTLVGVESGVQSVLKRFNKNISSEENIIGIRLLTGLGVPIRFTYITFDPLMSFEELKETYFFQGRTDLILNTEYKNDAEKLFDIATNESKSKEISLNIPFYSQIPYMLVSIECLLGSKYLKMAEENNLTTDSVIMALGKQEVHYLDERIEKMSKYSQLWIDRNFALDYSLKSLSKIYTGEISLKIRKQRVILKDYSYELLGKMLYLFEQDILFLKNCSCEEIEFMNNLRDNFLKLNDSEVVLKELLDHQFKLLTSQVFTLKHNLSELLSAEDFNKISTRIDEWSKMKDWKLLHGE